MAVYKPEAINCIRHQWRLETAGPMSTTPGMSGDVLLSRADTYRCERCGLIEMRRTIDALTAPRKRCRLKADGRGQVGGFDHISPNVVRGQGGS